MLVAEEVLGNKILCPSIFSAAKFCGQQLGKISKSKMAVSLFLEILPGCWPQNFAAEKMLGHKILLPRTSSALNLNLFVAEKVLGNKLLVAQKMLGSKFLVAEVILDNKILCPSMSSVTISGKH